MPSHRTLEDVCEIKVGQHRSPGTWQEAKWWLLLIAPDSGCWKEGPFLTTLEGTVPVGSVGGQWSKLTEQCSAQVLFRDILVCLGCYNKVPPIGRLIDS